MGSERHRHMADRPSGERYRRPIECSRAGQLLNRGSRKTGPDCRRVPCATVRPDEGTLDCPGAFAIPAAGAFGNLGRDVLRAPGLWQVDLGLSRYVNLTERANIRLRADLFNTFNRAQYGAPN